MSWDSKASYVSGATRKVPVQATDAQKLAWEVAAKKHGMASAGAFLAWAGDLYLALQRAYYNAVQEHEDAKEGPGGAERRRREREARQKGEND